METSSAELAAIQPSKLSHQALQTLVSLQSIVPLAELAQQDIERAGQQQASESNQPSGIAEALAPADSLNDSTSETNGPQELASTVSSVQLPILRTTGKYSKNKLPIPRFCFPTKPCPLYPNSFVHKPLHADLTLATAPI